ncbi:MAG: DUF1670 domain-containing protein [Dethiobacteria bacterium]|jgi:hypothetical protein
MGRQFTYRHRLKSEAASVKAKTLFDYLVSQVKARREVSYDEAELIADDAWQYLNNYLGMKQLGTLEIPAVVAEGDAHFRRSRLHQNEKLVKLTILEDDDADLLAEFGVRTMVTGRMARIIEEANHQGALLDFNRLCVLFPLNVSAIRERLTKLIEQGVSLPLAGTTKETRSKFKAPRAVLAIKRYLDGEKLVEIRKSLCISQNRWRQWWNSFRRVIKLQGEDISIIAGDISQPPGLVESWLELWEQERGEPTAEKVLKEDTLWPWEARDSFNTKPGFIKLLEERHGYSPAAAEEFSLELGELSKKFSGKARTGGQLIYIGVSSSVGPGKSLKEAELEPVLLDYLTSEDWAELNRDSPKELKWRRIERFATQAYAQGAALTLPDIAYLASISVDAVRDAIAEHPQVLLPTRGRVADMGSTLSHAEKIIDLFMYGYTETEIMRRSGHSLESVERYLLDFSKVVYLVESGMPLPAVRKVTDFSKRLVQKYYELYKRYATDDFIFAMSKIRRFARANRAGPNNRKKGDGKDDDG